MRKTTTVITALLTAAGAYGGIVANFPMDIDDGMTTETISAKKYPVMGNIGVMSVDSPDGNAWRTDGHSSFINARVGNIIDGDKMSVSIAFAIDTNVIISADNADANNRWGYIADCLDDDNKSGFAFMLGRTGKFAFKTYIGGQAVTVEGIELLQLWQWHELTATVDGNRVKLYLDGRLVKNQTVAGSGVKITDHRLLIGRDLYNNDTLAGVRTGDFNGAIDYITIRDEAITPAYTSTYADLNLPKDRYKNDRLRARFHGQPGMNWTNETHGLFYNPGDGRYHVFFQRTGSAPVMSHAHWGHIVSENLYDWHDDKPAIWPTTNFDLRGCWSGCLFTDEQITGGKPAILYTGVGYGPGESYSAMATCDDTEHLREWRKPATYIDKYNDTQRDTYFFRTDADNAYFVIGDNGYLRQYRWNGNGWSNHGSFYNFCEGESGFTEMPNISKLPNGKWLMTFTPTSPDGVVCTYRIGDIDGNGKFVNYTPRRQFDFLAHDGYGLMSPSIGADKNGNLIAIGIVADKMPTDWNVNHGYAHLYSLPRTLYIDSEGRLCQKPFAGYEKMRGTTYYLLDQPTRLNGKMALNPVRGRQAEICATFRVGEASFGIKFLEDKNGRCGKLTYNPDSHEVRLNVNDIVGENYGSKEMAHTLEIYPAKGEEFKIHLFIDHSIVDIFLNDRYAASVRVFPSSMEHDLIEVFSNGNTLLTGLEAYMIKEGDCREEPITPTEPVEPEVLESTGKAALYVVYDNEEELNGNLQEHGAADLFRSIFPHGTIIYNNPTAIRASVYDCIWMHIERDNIKAGWDNLPAAAKNSNLISALKKYVADGGNLYLSKHASQLITAIGRTAGQPAEFGDTDPKASFTRNDLWQTNIHAYDTDWSGHPIFTDIPYDETDYGKVITLLGLGTKHYDRNVMWRLNDFGGHDKFCQDNNARVLGTWGHSGGQDRGGIIEFLPTGSNKKSIAADKVKQRKGTIITNGLAAYQIAPIDGTTNPYQSNIDRLTSNILYYLSPVTSGSGVTEVSADAEASPRWFTLQGIEVSEPTQPGIYIRVHKGIGEKMVVGQ